MKKIGIIICCVCLVIVFHFNLPSNDIKNNFNREEGSGVFDKLATFVLASDTLANWQIYDFVIIKVARSERLDIVLIGLPFCKWMSWSIDKQ